VTEEQRYLFHCMEMFLGGRNEVSEAPREGQERFHIPGHLALVEVDMVLRLHISPCLPQHMVGQMLKQHFRQVLLEHLLLNKLTCWIQWLGAIHRPSKKLGRLTLTRKNADPQALEHQLCRASGGLFDNLCKCSPPYLVRRGQLHTQ